MKKIIYPITIIVLGAITFGSVYAVQNFVEPVNVIGDTLRVIDGDFVVTRTDGQNSFWTIKNDGRAGVLNYHLVDDLKKFQLIFLEDGSRFSMRYIDDTNPSVEYFSVLSSNGNVGIADITPEEKLDVNGNIRLTGNIVSPNDICIGNCP